MKKIYLGILLTLSSVLTLVSQTVHKDYWDGKIYLRTEILVPELGTNSRNLDLKEAPFLNADLIANYGITSISKPFYRATEKSIRTIYLLEFNQIDKIDELIAYLSRHNLIDYAEMVPIHKTTLTPNDLGGNSTSGNGQWHLHIVEAEEAWDFSVGSPNIKVAIVDDAVLSNHPDLAPALWVNPGEIPGNGIDDDGNGYIDDVNGYDVADDDNNVMPNNSNMSHGTHVAGIAGAKTNNGVGVASIGFGVSIMAVKSSNQATTITNGYDGIVYAADAGAHVINMSWGGSGGGNTGQNIVNYAFNKGCILVAAAGNDNVTTVFYPANYNNVIAVASTTTNDQKSSFSNYGTWIDISAPGSAIYSTYVGTGITATYQRIQGTSMASPFVAGMIGLMLSYNPNLTPTQVYNCLYSTAEPTSNFVGQMGAGRFNAKAAMECVASTLQQAPVGQINASETNVCSGTTINFSGSSIGGQATSYSWLFPGGTPSSSNLQNPSVTYNTNGNYNVTLITTNQYGSDTLVLPNYITISNQAAQVLFFEDFEGASSPMTVNNPDNGITWAVVNAAGNPPGSKSVYMNFYNYNTTGRRDGLITPSINASSNTGLSLTFKHAYKRYNQASSDSLIIYASTNNGTTWTRIFNRGENGSGNFATATTSQTNFIPSQASDWCYSGTVGSPCYTIDLSAYDGVPNLRLKFEGYNNYGNNLYLDDIKVTGTCANNLPAPPIPNYTPSSTTICEGEQITYTNNTQNADSYSWTFSGGNPPSSTLANPTVTYNTAGTYTVVLQATNQGGSNTVTNTNSITVNPNPNVSVTFNNGVLSANPAGLTYQWYLNNSFITGANQQSYVPSASGTYTVKVTNQYGCSVTSAPMDIVVTSGVEDFTAMLFNIFPNPTNDYLQVVWDNMEIEELQVIDVYGRVLSSYEVTNSNNYTIPTYHLANGVYFIKPVNAKAELPIKRFIVKH